MYQKPEIRIIQDQQVEATTQEVSSYEASDLLAKYGYTSKQTYHSDPKKSSQTVEDFYNQHDREIELQRQKELQKRFGPKAYTFDNNNINYSSSDYRSLEDGIGIQVQVVSDMPIYNNRRY